MATYFLSSASGAAGTNTGASWANAFKTLDACLAKPLANGDNVWIGDDHSETVVLAGAKTLSWNGSQAAPVTMYCVDHTKSAPGAGDLKTTASITYSTGAFGVTFSGNLAHCYGVNWIVGSGVSANGSFLQFGQNNGVGGHFEKCTFTFASTFASTTGFYHNRPENFTDCTFKFGANGQSMAMQGASVTRMFGCIFDTQGFTSGGAASLFALQAGAIWYAENCDFSAVGSSNIFFNTGSDSTAALKRCVTASTTGVAFAQTNGPLSLMADFIQCDGGGSLLRNERWWGNGASVASAVVARVGGFQDGTTPASHRGLSTATARWSIPFQLFPIAIWNNTVGSSVNVTVEMIADPRAAEFAAIPKNDEVWIEAEYLGTTSSTKGSTVKGTKAGALDAGTALTASTADWTAGTVPARGNSTTYAVGAAIKVASNPGRVFFCSAITTGITAASEPGGYASAVDGGSVTDGGATFKAGWRFKQTVTITPQAAGLIYVQPKIAKASLVGGIFVDPLVVLS